MSKKQQKARRKTKEKTTTTMAQITQIYMTFSHER